MPLEKTMTPSEYQEKIKTYRLPTYNAEAAVLGLLSEAGEVAGVFNRLIRGDYDADTAANKLHYELGDILWNVAAICNDNEWTFEEVMKNNIDKLESRRIRGMLLGQGDNR